MKNKNISRALHIIFALMLFSVLLFFFVGELVMPMEDPTERGECALYDGDWEHVLPDGTRESVNVPGQCKAERNEVVRLETTLNQELNDTWFCMRASQQDMYVYVDDVLIKEYSTVDSRLFGKKSASAFVFFKVSNEDAGKTLAIELISDSAEYSGFINKVYVGEKSDIVKELVRQCFVVISISLYMLILSSMIVAVGCVLRLVYKRSVDIIYLGLGTMLLGMSMTVESNIRQFFLPNSSIAAHVGFLLTILIPYPFMVYVSRLQNRRYEKCYKILAVGVLFNFIASVILQVTGTVDLVDSTAISYAIIILMVSIFAVTILVDIKKKRIAEYGEVIIGIIVMIIISIWETCIMFIPSMPYQGGVALGIGLIVLLFSAACKAAREMVTIEKEKQMAIASSQAKAQFLANMSHEIRTPINTIIGMNEMILRENQDESVQEYANNVNSASKMLLGLINDVLDFSKIESGKMDIVNEEYYLSKMLTDVINGVRIRAESKNLNFITDVDETLPSVLKGDEIRIRQILNNLLSNAVKYTKHGSITLSVRGIREKDTIILNMAVEDTGMGIQPQDMKKMFESFQRLEESRNRYIEGTGLGLNITKQLAELMGGDIYVTSEYEKGSCFIVNIPQQIVDTTPLGKLEEAYRRVVTEKKDSKQNLYAPNAKILVVDDNRMNLAVVSALLKRTGIKVVLAHGGQECLELCKKIKFDLIFMDHMMPDPDGIETFHLLRNGSHNLNKNTTVIVLTANAVSGMAQMYLKEGFADYLTKPVVADELEKMITKYLPKELQNVVDDIGEKSGIYHIDKKLGMEYCGNDAGIYQEMIKEYCSQGKEYLAKLEAFYNERDWKNYRTTIHALKNTSLLIGAVEFSEKAKRLEHAAGEANEAVLRAECEGFLEEYRIILGKVE